MNQKNRIPAVNPLTENLPKGAESGKEFARIIGLLLLNEAKRSGNEFMLFDDASGDFEGLDSYSRNPNTKEVVGYQYKFFKSPLTDGNRQDIKSSLNNAVQRSKKLKLKKWILVTPEDLTNSGRKKTGGDVDWFEGLAEEANSKFSVEHIGHSKIIELFLLAPHICLFYYPELVKDGIVRKKSIQHLRVLYDQQMKKRYGKIEFVGMSIYKDIAARRVPLEDIYIPLSVVSEKSPPENDFTPRVDPIRLLDSGTKSVILGDPGSGKSTLLSFLALVGISAELQMKCGNQSDQRLTVVVSLRRYADELKYNTNLSILDYILSSTKADLSMNDLDQSFYAFYLESGQSIVLFDGLDELPNSKFKSIVRSRIESFSDAYPNNTTIVTSRLIGYEADARFGVAYGHYRVAKLRPAEIEKFILDWYESRVDDIGEGKRSASDLVKVITKTENESIRDLARNPLLLTIVTLVHRIDAVLPDQRVVLYQKCTETLLETWHKAKYRNEEPTKNRIERNNRLRIEAIAYWMHKNSTSEEGRSVVTYKSLLEFLTAYIKEKERPRDIDDPAEDQAEAFISFVKNSAGLMVEAGDKLYSFIHLTFQEYLCATHIFASSEVGGAQSIWTKVNNEFRNARWREVVRLLIASLKSIEGQKFYVEKLLDENISNPTTAGIMLLLGLLNDGIDPAEEQSSEIVNQALLALIACTDSDEIRIVSEAIKNWIGKKSRNEILIKDMFEKIFEHSTENNKLILALINAEINLPQLSEGQKQKTLESLSGATSSLLRVAIFDNFTEVEDENLAEIFFALHMRFATTSAEKNLASVVLLSIAMLLNPKNSGKYLIKAELGLFAGMGLGPHSDHARNIVAIAKASSKDMHPAVNLALSNSLKKGKDQARQRIARDLLHRKIGKYTELRVAKNVQSMTIETRLVSSYWGKKARELNVPGDVLKNKPTFRDAHGFSEISLIKASFLEKIESSPSYFWKMYSSSESFSSIFTNALIKSSHLNSELHWVDALRFSLKEKVPKVFSNYLEFSEWERLAETSCQEQQCLEDLDKIAWLMLLDIWLWSNFGYKDFSDSPLKKIADLSVKSTYIPLRVCLALRNCVFDRIGSDNKLDEIRESHRAEVDELLESTGWLFDRSINSVENADEEI